MLETEKQELLNETHDLSLQNKSYQQEVNTARNELNSIIDRMKDMAQQSDLSKNRNSELLEELKAGVRREEEMKIALQV